MKTTRTGLLVLAIILCLPLVSHGQMAVWGKDKKLFAASYREAAKKSTIEIYTYPDKEIVQSIEHVSSTSAPIDGLYISQGDASVITRQKFDYTIYDIKTGEKLHEFTAKNLFFSKNRAVYVTPVLKKYEIIGLEVSSAATGTPVQTLKFKGPLDNVWFSQNDGYLVAKRRNYSDKAPYWLFDLRDSKPKPLTKFQCNHLAFLEGDTMMVTIMENNALVYELPYFRELHNPMQFLDLEGHTIFMDGKTSYNSKTREYESDYNYSISPTGRYMSFYTYMKYKNEGVVYVVDVLKSKTQLEIYDPKYFEPNMRHRWLNDSIILVGENLYNILSQKGMGRLDGVDDRFVHLSPNLQVRVRKTSEKSVYAKLNIGEHFIGGTINGESGQLPKESKMPGMEFMGFGFDSQELFVKPQGGKVDLIRVADLGKFSKFYAPRDLPSKDEYKAELARRDSIAKVQAEIMAQQEQQLTAGSTNVPKMKKQSKRVRDFKAKQKKLRAQLDKKRKYGKVKRSKGDFNAFLAQTNSGPAPTPRNYTRPKDDKEHKQYEYKAREQEKRQKDYAYKTPTKNERTKRRYESMQKPEVSEVLLDGEPPEGYNYLRLKDFKPITDAGKVNINLSLKNALSLDSMVELNVHLLDTMGNFYTGVTGDMLKSWCGLTVKYPDGSVRDVNDFDVVEYKYEDPLPDAYVIVLDHSRSMGIDRAFILQDGVEQFIDEKKDIDALAVIKYDCNVKVEARLSTDKEALKLHLRKNGLDDFGGSTSILDGIFEGIQLLESAEGYERRTVIILTDGIENCSKQKRNKTIKEAMANGIKVSVIGFGNYVSPPYLESIAYNTGGSLYQIYDTENLTWIYDDVIKKEKSYYSVKFKSDTVGKHTAILKFCLNDKTHDTLMVGFENDFPNINQINEGDDGAFGVPLVELEPSQTLLEAFYKLDPLDTLSNLISSNGSNVEYLEQFLDLEPDILDSDLDLMPELLGFETDSAYRRIKSEFEQLKFPDIKFVFDKTEIVPGTDKELVNVVTFLKTHSKLVIEVGGHTDSWGSDTYNLRLSERRAKKVKDLLITQGISAQRIVGVGYGEFHPLMKNTTNTNRLKNRRVEFKLLRYDNALAAMAKNKASE